jgi:cytochrome c5
VDAALGATVYNQTCVVCHGADGKGAIPGVPDFTAADGALAKSDDVLLQHIIEGFKSPEAIMMMPARGGNPALTDAELAATLAHIRTNFSR